VKEKTEISAERRVQGGRAWRERRDLRVGGLINGIASSSSAFAEATADKASQCPAYSGC